MNASDYEEWLDMMSKQGEIPAPPCDPADREAYLFLINLRDRLELADEDVKRWCFARYLFHHLVYRVVPTQRETLKRQEHRWITIRERPCKGD